jgi:hypothetical protein
MQLADIGPIPKPIRAVILALLLLAVLCSAGLGLYFALIKPDTALAIASLGAVQASLTGLVVVATVLFSFRMKQTRDIEKIIDSFFIDDMMTAFQSVHIAPPDFVAFTDARAFRKIVQPSRTLSHVSTDFSPGRDAAGFRISEAAGPIYDIYLKVNIKHITVKYFFDAALYTADDADAEFKRYFEQTLTGAQSVGYSFKLIRRYHASKQADVLELSLYLQCGADMLANPAERLFLRNDLRSMTASMIHTDTGVRALKAR